MPAQGMHALRTLRLREGFLRRIYFLPSLQLRMSNLESPAWNFNQEDFK